MAMIWPPGLPFFNRADGHSRTGPVGAVIRTPMDAGPAKARRRSTAAPKSYTGQIPWLTKQQFATFEEFVTQTIADGALPFEVEDQFDGLVKTFRFTDDPPYQAVPAGRGVQVSASLEIVARPARATMSIAARISGDPVQAFVGDTLYAVRAVYAGEPGTLGDEWYRVSTGAVVGTGASYTVRQADAFDQIGYRTKAINGPTSTATPVQIDAVPQGDVIVVGSQRVVQGAAFVVASSDVEYATVLSGTDTVMSGTDTVVVPL